MWPSFKGLFWGISKLGFHSFKTNTSGKSEVSLHPKLQLKLYQFIPLLETDLCGTISKAHSGWIKLRKCVFRSWWLSSSLHLCILILWQRIVTKDRVLLLLMFNELVTGDWLVMLNLVHGCLGVGSDIFQKCSQVGRDFGS